MTGNDKENNRKSAQATQQVGATAMAVSVEVDLQRLARNWRAFMIRGALAVVMGVIAFFLPAETAAALAIIFGAFAFADGVLALWSGVSRMRQGERWGWLIINGLLGIGTGLVVLIAPMVATLVLAIFLWTMVAFWSITTGVAEILIAIRLRKAIEGEWLMLLGGLASILTGVVITWFILINPAGSIVALGWLFGLYAVILGLLLWALGLKLKRIDQSANS